MSTRRGSDCATRWTTSSPICPRVRSAHFVNSDFGDVAIATIAITGEGFSYREMKDVAESFRKKLYQLPGVAKIDLLGTQDERVWLEIDTGKLASVGVQLDALIKDLRAQNIILPSGSIDADGTRVLLETSGDFPNVRAIETMLTRVGTTDSLVRLADLVTVQRGYVTPKVKPIYFNGRPGRRAGHRHAARPGRHAARRPASRGSAQL